MQEFWDSITGWAKDNLSDWGLIKVYIGCLIAGATVLLGQLGLNLFGFGADGDVDPDADVDDLDGGDSLNFLSIRALAGFLGMFGAVGWSGTAAEWGTGPTLMAATGAGAGMMLFVALVMRQFKRLDSSGNIKPQNAVGKTARVYLRIPANKSGKGKITVSIQGQNLEFAAMTSGDELPSGSECRVVSQLSDTTFEVAALD